MKSLLYTLFGFGKIPPGWNAILVREGVRLRDEGVPASLTRINYRDMKRRSSWCRRSMLPVAIVLTRQRLIVFNETGRKVINVPVGDDRFRQMRFAAENEDRLCIAFDVGLFHPDLSGTLEYRLRTPQARRMAEALNEPMVAASGSNERVA